MRATHGTAIYTGGGIYNVIGETDNGLWFFGYPEGCMIVDSDIREKDEIEDDLACYYGDWLLEHEVEIDEKEANEMFEEFCRRLDTKEPGITEGYEEFSNYVPGEVTDYINFSELLNYQPNGNVIAKGVTPDEVGAKLTLEIINNDLIYEFALMVKTLEKINDILTEIDNDKEHKGYYIGFENPENEKDPLIKRNMSDEDDIEVWYRITYTNGDFNLHKIVKEK